MNNIIMGDWNSSVGDKSYRNIVGSHELGRRNYRGQILIDFCERNGLIVTNTWFKKPKRRLYTWKALGDWSQHQLDYIFVKHRFRNSVKDVQTLPGSDIDSDHNLPVAKVHTRLKKIIRFQKSRPRWDLEKLYAQRQRVDDTPEEKLGALECESGNAEVQWKNIKECVLDTIGDLAGKVEKRARKPWITQEMISKMGEQRKRKNVNTEEGRRNYRRLRNGLKRATEKAKKEYLENTCNEIMEFHRTDHYDLMYMKTKGLVWKETQGIQNIGIEDSQGNRIVDKRQVLKIWENYVIELYDRPNRLETLEVEPEEEVDTDKKGPYILQSEVEKAIKEMRNRKATGDDDDVPGDVIKLLGEGGLKILTNLLTPYMKLESGPRTSQKLQ